MYAMRGMTKVLAYLHEEEEKGVRLHGCKQLCCHVVAVPVVPRLSVRYVCAVQLPSKAQEGFLVPAAAV